MRRARRLAALAWLVLAGPVLAEAPALSPRPAARPTSAPAPIFTAAAPARSPRPLPRPDATPDLQAATGAALVAALQPPVDPVAALIESLGGKPGRSAPAPAAFAGASALAVPRSPLPRPRPRGFDRRVAATAARRASLRGAVCGVPEIKGTAIARISGRGGCGIARPVRLSSVSGVALAIQPSVDCTTAKALNAWVKESVIPDIGRRGGGVARLNIIDAYACRTRDSIPGAKLSEHAKGHAVDVSGVTLRDGTTLAVEREWRGRYAKLFRAMHDEACGPFGTVLGPNSDRYHYNHFHLDTARYRGGAYCR